MVQQKQCSNDVIGKRRERHYLASYRRRQVQNLKDVQHGLSQPLKGR
jgi:hypothetical protein